MHNCVVLCSNGPLFNKPGIEWRNCVRWLQVGPKRIGQRWSQLRRHGRALVGSAIINKAPSPPKIEIWNIINQGSFCQILECQVTLLKTFWRRFGVATRDKTKVQAAKTWLATKAPSDDAVVKRDAGWRSRKVRKSRSPRSAGRKWTSRSVNKPITSPKRILRFRQRATIKTTLKIWLVSERHSAGLKTLS